MYLVSLGEIKAPEGMEEGWTDPYPLPLRVLALVKWTLLVLFQVCNSCTCTVANGFTGWVPPRVDVFLVWFFLKRSLLRCAKLLCRVGRYSGFPRRSCWLRRAASSPSSSSFFCANGSLQGVSLSNRKTSLHGKVCLFRLNWNAST